LRAADRRRLLHRGHWLDLWTALEVDDVGFGGALMPLCLWWRRLEGGGDGAEQIGLGTSGSECEADARDGFGDTGADFEKPVPDRCELGFGQLMGPWHRLAER
jgi:hypothetical protein